MSLLVVCMQPWVVGTPPFVVGISFVVGIPFVVDAPSLSSENTQHTLSANTGSALLV